MTLANDLKNLKPGDGLVMRDGTLRSFEHYNGGKIVACGFERPFVWTGKIGRRENRSEKFWDIVRVIKAKKAKPDKDAAWLHHFANDRVNALEKSEWLRIRKISKRLEEMK